MISHKHKCIFVHIPRTAGTSVETWLVGRDYWDIDQYNKHLTASQAKARYGPFWDMYFKFSIVRHPYTRFASCLKYAGLFGLSVDKSGDLDFSGYHDLFGTDVIVEHEHRFYNLRDVKTDAHLPGQVYGNILDAPLDAIYSFETLNDDMSKLQKVLGIEEAFPQAKLESSYGDQRELTSKDKDYLASICRLDMETFGYR